MIRHLKADPARPASVYQATFFLFPRTVFDRRAQRFVRVWGSGMMRRWSDSERCWHYRSKGEKA